MPIKSYSFIAALLIQMEQARLEEFIEKYFVSDHDDFVNTLEDEDKVLDTCMLHKAYMYLPGLHMQDFFRDRKPCG